MLKIKNLNIKSFSENVVYISTKCQLYDVSQLRALTKVEIHGGKKPVYAFLQTIDNENIVSATELGLNFECFNDLELQEGDNVSLNVAAAPDSLTYIKKKTYGNVLSAKEYSTIIKDIISKRYSNMDIAAFLVAMGSFMTLEEVLSLTKALIGDKKISWDNEDIVVDHYCIGGIPGNKTDILITAIVSAYGMSIPKTCSYSLTSCAGIANVANVFMKIDCDEEKFKSIVKENHGAIVLYDGLNIGKFNKMISPVEKYIGLAKVQQLAASIIAIKITCGVTHLLVDIPVGPNAKIRTTTDAMELRKIMEYVGDQIGVEIEAVITDGREPIGSGIGPFLEARDIMKILKNKDDAPLDLKEKAIFMAGKILDFDPKLRGGQGAAVAQELLASGRAFDAFNKIILAQGKVEKPEIGFLYKDILADAGGVVKGIDNAAMNYLGILSGSSRNKGSGIEMFKKIGDSVLEEEPLFRIYSNHQSDFVKASNFAEHTIIYDISF